jgi:anti-anti-sigma factor
MEAMYQRIVIHAKRLDGSSAVTLGGALDAAWRGGARAIAIDLSEVEEINSFGISCLVAHYRRRPRGTVIVLCGLREYVREVVEVTQLHRVIDVFDSSEAAALALSA